MSVYVDKARNPFGRMIMCHMIADTTEELLAMADTIGVDRRHLQDAGTYREHFDVGVARRARALDNGAIEIDRRRLAQIMQAKRTGEKVQKWDTKDVNNNYRDR